MLSKPVEEAVEGLIELGVLNEKGLIRLAQLFSAIRTLKEAGADPVAPQPTAAKEPEKPPELAHPKAPEAQEPDPEFTNELELPIQASARPKALSGFIAAYSEKNLLKEPTAPKKRKLRGSFHITPQDLMALRSTKTIKQIAIEYGV